ncbi:ribonuclease P protein component [Rhodanobacter sp. 7MK24]|uniref:ribonuclease P protein component n=1 Tax=Rhodanobacter sp. 7MK24 TaxID=2775922 RepID=UPI00177B19D9|nr:ribonuclease P protein component [Rhodanobacter sp. 7MK24]MBD8881667.1 ribonuclease P protein component [Rhodanobacter sp. 7MK24]
MRPAGLPRQSRLRLAGDFAALRASSGRLGGRCFHLRYRPNGLPHARLGLAISKRASKLAVDRNRLKRLLRESFRNIRDRLPPVDVVVMAREQAVQLSGAELLAEADALWRRLAAIRLEPVEPAPDATQRH